MKLRPHQDDAIRAYRGARARARRILLVAPTGAGKTVISGFLVREAARAGAQVLVLAPWRVLIPQTVARYSELMDPKSIGVLMSGRKPNPDRQIQIGSIETVRRWLDRLNLKPGLVVVDEAHRAASKTRAEMLEQWQCPQLLLTATPYRKQGGGLGRIADEIIAVASISELIDTGFLVPAVTYSGDPDRVEGVPILRTTGDYDAGELADAMAKPKLVGDIVSDWERLARGRPTLAFSCNIAHSHQLRDAFLEAGVRAEHLDGSTGARDRRAILGRLESGETQVVTNCNVLTEGFDQPSIACVVARPTASLGVWVQQAGRGLRIADGKKNCVLLDPGGNAHRFGLIDTPWSFTLNAAPPTALEDPELEPELATCEVCGAVMPRNVRSCPGCNEYDARPRVPVAVEGELEKVEVENDRRAELRQLIAVARGTGYGALWAAEQWADRYGRPPGELRRGVLAELRRQAEVEERPDRWVANRLAELYR